MKMRRVMSHATVRDNKFSRHLHISCASGIIFLMILANSRFELFLMVGWVSILSRTSFSSDNWPDSIQTSPLILLFVTFLQLGCKNIYCVCSILTERLCNSVLCIKFESICIESGLWSLFCSICWSFVFICFIIFIFQSYCVSGRCHQSFWGLHRSSLS